MEPVSFQIDEQGIAILKIQRPQARNALNWEAMHAFAEAVEQAHASAALRVLIVTGDEIAFCAGGDLFELHDFPSHDDGIRLSTVMGQALNRLETLPCPTLAAIEGPAMGGGAEIALASDLRVASRSARLGLMHVRLAICPAWGGAQRLVSLVGYARALEWLAMGTILDADEALRFGLINRATPPGQALPEAMEMAQRLAANDPAAVQAIKRVLRAGLIRPDEQATIVERKAFANLWSAAPHLAASQRFVQRRVSSGSDGA